MPDRIQAERSAHGWSQSELARRAGVTRQLVSALESGRHVPNVAAALGLAEALGTTVENLFGDRERALGQPEGLLGEPVADGAVVQAARVGSRLIAVTAHAETDESWATADGIIAGRSIRWLPGVTAADLLIAGCDPLLGILSRLTDDGRGRMLTAHVSTGKAVQALADGRVHGVLVHGPADELPQPPVPVRRWHVAGWQVGIAAPGAKRSVPSIDELAARRARVVQRDSGAGAQRAFERALRSAGSPAEVPGPIGDGHIDVARRVSYGGAAAGVLMEPAALAFDLRFTALEEHTVQLWIAHEWMSLPSVSALLQTLTGQAALQRARLLPGYDTTSFGTEIRPPAGAPTPDGSDIRGES